MGFKIACPNCGPRSYYEFSFGGEVRDRSTQATAEENYRRIWLRANVAGRQRERWFHEAGCRRWLTIERDTRTNEIHAAREPDAS
jgi:heterotetrameric sarcosine oxidase delta subunit